MDSVSSSGLSSDLSSVGSLSPPPMDYPSPISSQDCDSSTFASQQPSRKRSQEPDDVPPTKKRRRVEVKPRTTEHLNLQLLVEDLATDQTAQLNLLLKVLQKRRKIVVIAGAGISVSAGIPDFRSSTGLFSSLRSEHKLKASGKHLFDASVYQTDSSTSSFHDMVRSLSQLVSDAKPTVFHHMLAALASEGRLMRLYTQNVDGIDTSLPPLETSVPLNSKGPWPRTIQLHGGLEKMVCSKCNILSDFEPALFNGPVPPLCTACVETDKVRTDHAGKRSHGIGRLRPRIVLYNEHNPDEEAIGTVMSSDLRARPDAVIVVGTSMKIPGVRRIVREMCGVVRGRRDGLAVWINRGPPPVGKEFEDCWDLIVEGDCDRVANHAKMRRWNDDGIDHKNCTESEVERAKQRSEVEVIIESPRKKGFTDALLTPAASPRPKTKVLLKLKGPKPTKDKVSSSARRPKANPKKQVHKNAISKASKAPATAKINSSFKVTKTTQSLLVVKKKKPITPVSSEDDLCKAMVPISPQAARNNGPLQNPTKSQSAKPLFPNLVKASSTTPLPLENTGRLKRMSEEIVSPTTTPPKMANLLN